MSPHNGSKSTRQLICTRFYILGVMGGAISPAITGLFVQYTSSSWRGTLYMLAALSATTLVLQLLFVPNTQHTPTPYATLRGASGERWIFRWSAVNPWICIRTLRNWRLAAIVSASGSEGCSYLSERSRGG